MTVVPEDPVQLSQLKDAFAHGAKLSPPSENDVKGSIQAVAHEVTKRPIRKRDILPYSIGRVSEVFNNAPEYLTRQEVKDHHQKNPKTLFSGVGYGAWSFVKGIGTGLSGIVVEPYKGAKENGFKGATIGVGKGFIGLVAKPVAGTFGLVQYTVQGTINTPSTIKGAFKKTSKKKEPQEETKGVETYEADSEYSSKPELSVHEIEEFQAAIIAKA